MRGLSFFINLQNEAEIFGDYNYDYQIFKCIGFYLISLNWNGLRNVKSQRSRVYSGFKLPRGNIIENTDFDVKEKLTNMVP